MQNNFRWTVISQINDGKLNGFYFAYEPTANKVTSRINHKHSRTYIKGVIFYSQKPVLKDISQLTLFNTKLS